MADVLSLTTIHSPRPCPACGEPYRRFVTDDATNPAAGLIVVCIRCAELFEIELGFPEITIRPLDPMLRFALQWSSRRAAIEKIQRVLRRRREEAP